MSEKRCVSCGLLTPPAKHITDLPDMLLPAGQCGALLHPVWVEGCLERRLQNLETEVAAWRALARRFPQPVFIGNDEDGWLLEVGNSYGNGSGNTPQAAVLCIARQLKLIPEAK